MTILTTLDESFTRFSLRVDQKISRHSLLDLPAGWPWRVFQLAVYCHTVAASMLLVAGVACFCTGIQNSFPYTQVNCTHGSSLAAPLVNLLVVFLGMVALRQPENSWSAFLHFTFGSIALAMNLYFAWDMLSMGLWWKQEAERERIQGHPRLWWWWYDEWPENFAWMDLLICALLMFIELTYVVTVGSYIALKCNVFRR